jgi:hypothetical protein
MKRHHLSIHLLGLVGACLVGVGCATQPGGATAAPPNSGHLIVSRVANFGTDLSLVLSVDGKDVAALTEGQNYDGYLPAGQHVLTARVDPNRVGTPPRRKTITAQAGQTYSYTAAWSGEKLVLVSNP